MTQPPAGILEYVRTYREVLPLMVLALALRLLSVYPVHRAGMTSDEAEFTYMADRVASGGSFVDSNGDRSVRAPLYVYVLAFCFLVAGKSLDMPLVLNALAGMAAVGVGFALAMRVFGDRRTAFATGILLTVYPGLVIYGALVQTEAPFIFLFLLVFLFVYRVLDGGGYGASGVLGLLSGLATLTRAVFLPFFFVLAGLVWLSRRGSAGGGGRHAALATAVFLAVIAPWTMRNAMVHGAVVPVTTVGGRSLLLANNPFSHGTPRLDPGFDGWFSEQAAARGVTDLRGLSEIQETELSRRVALGYIGSHPRHVLFLALERMYVFWVYPVTHTDSYHPIQAVAVGADFLLLTGAALGVAVTWRQRRRLLPLAAAVLTFSAIHAVLHAEARYRLPIIPIVSLYAGSGFAFASSAPRLRSFFREGSARYAFFALCGVVVLVYGFTALQFLRGAV